jgi:beta-alanine--pyruvate transaminase
VRAAGDNLVLCPPYIVDKAQIDQLVGTLATSIKKHA